MIYTYMYSYTIAIYACVSICCIVCDICMYIICVCNVDMRKGVVEKREIGDVYTYRQKHILYRIVYIL